MLAQIVLIMFQKLTYTQLYLHYFGINTKTRMTHTQKFDEHTMFLKIFITFA